jgi:uncharacterized protein with HEPN domain
MHSDTAIAALRDIEHHIALAVHFAQGFDYETFRDDPRTVYAVTRCLEIISDDNSAVVRRARLTSERRGAR